MLSRFTDTARLVEDAGRQASAVTTDVTRPDDVARLVETTVARHGRLDVAFNNAGVLVAAPLVDLDASTWSSLVEGNLTSVWLSMKYEGPTFISCTAPSSATTTYTPHLQRSWHTRF